MYICIYLNDISCSNYGADLLHTGDDDHMDCTAGDEEKKVYTHVCIFIAIV
jgi:hypothetical protein